MPIEFNMEDLNLILKTEKKGLDIYIPLGKSLIAIIFSILLQLETFVSVVIFPMISAIFPFVYNSYPCRFRYFIVFNCI